MHSIHLVAQFHKAFAHPIASSVNAGDKALRRLRLALLLEEVGELAVALGVPCSLDVTFVGNSDELQAVATTAPDEDCLDNDKVNMTEAADALGDIDYVTQGANLVFGLPAEAITAEIHRSNMSKLGEDGKPIYRADGKILKGPNYFGPKIDHVLMTHPFGYNGEGALAANAGRRFLGQDAANKVANSH